MAFLEGFDSFSKECLFGPLKTLTPRGHAGVINFFLSQLSLRGRLRVFSFDMLGDIAKEGDKQILGALMGELNQVADSTKDSWHMGHLMDSIAKVLPKAEDPEGLRDEVQRVYEALAKREDCPLEIRVKMAMMANQRRMTPLEWVKFLDARGMMFTVNQKKAKKGMDKSPTLPQSEQTVPLETQMRDSYYRGISEGICIEVVWAQWRYAPQLGYTCDTCPTGCNVICASCVEKCHNGHEVSEASFGGYHCCCGLLCKCLAKEAS